MTNEDLKRMVNKQYTVEYKPHIIVSSKIIEADGFSSIIFRNLGDDLVTIFGMIPVTVALTDANNQEQVFINRPDEIIKQDISVHFAGVGSNPQLLITKVYYKAISNSHNE